MKKMTISIVIILGIIVLAIIALDGTFLPKTYRYSADETSVNAYADERDKLIAYAIGAPSGHNMQPWLVKKVDEHTICLYADMAKQLPVIDENNNQLLISQGAFIEKFLQGAEQLGYEVTIEYAKIDLTQDDPLIATFH